MNLSAASRFTVDVDELRGLCESAARRFYAVGNLQQEFLALGQESRDVGGQYISEELKLDGLDAEVNQSNASGLGFNLRLFRQQRADPIEQSSQLCSGGSVAQSQDGLHQHLVARGEVLDVRLRQHAGRYRQQALLLGAQADRSQSNVFDHAGPV